MHCGTVLFAFVAGAKLLLVPLGNLVEIVGCNVLFRSESESCAADCRGVYRRALRFILLRAGINGQAGRMDLFTIHAQCTRRRFNFYLLAGLAHVHTADEHADEQQAAENKNNETAADDGENPENCVIAFWRRWLWRNRRAARRADWCG